MAVALQGWHPGEVSIQRRLGFADAVSDRWRYVGKSMPDQHRLFHTSNLSFIPVTTIDEHGRPWASIMAGQGGNIGFVQSPSPQALSIHACLWDGDPMLRMVEKWRGNGISAAEQLLTAGLGIEFSTRRRNKFAGRIQNVRGLGSNAIFDVEVNEALGLVNHLRFSSNLSFTNNIDRNCPKYINVYNMEPFERTQPRIIHKVEHIQQSDRLTQDVIDFILGADTVFVGSIYKSQGSTAKKFPSHAGMNARSGLPGFLRVSPSDGRTIVLPDYSGNRFVSSLGNIEATGLVAFTIVSFITGDVLYMTGTAENIVGQEALRIMDRHSAITVVKVTGFTFVKDALPLRQKAGVPVDRSPYSPKIKYLVEESGSESSTGSTHKAKLETGIQLSEDLAVFRFKIDQSQGASKLKLRPGQAIVLDFMDWIGPPQYQHMSNAKPSLLNDDRVRTWTVSSAHESGDVTGFELTMREVTGGAVTGALFDILRTSNKPYGQTVKSEKEVVAEVVGVTGDFYLGQTGINALWVAGGIGITPFVAMLDALSQRQITETVDIKLALSTREPDLMLDLLRGLLARLSPSIQFTIDIFTNAEPSHAQFATRENQNVFFHQGRIPSQYWKDIDVTKDVLICGPNAFGDSAVRGLQDAGVPLERIQREGFY